MKTLRLHRFNQNTTQSASSFTVHDHKNFPLFASVALERGWRNNKQRVSCIPRGIYVVKLEYSNAFKKKLWEIKGVYNRSECKFHSANYWKQLNGCVALGKRFDRDINNDGYRDVQSSGDTMKLFHSIMGNDTEAMLHITGEANIY